MAARLKKVREDYEPRSASKQIEGILLSSSSGRLYLLLLTQLENDFVCNMLDCGQYC